ncbi:MAG: FAD-dependent thymidylate synthase, partial [Parachlamydiaceae bacterium]|nr:FAD-dependent thymidylate synthase [Parachlamydiaceae bacterium]
MLLDDYEEFTEEQIKTLEKYVTNTRGHIYVLRNLPEVIKGALFSRYSRSNLGLRTLLLKEFIGNNDETSFETITGAAHPADNNPASQTAAIQKAQNFYDRILDGYGDDSIGELGGGHVAIENISMLAAKMIEDSRIGGSPLEKSTRYIYFDQKVQGEYLFYREPVLMTSAYRDLYINTCNMLFDTYSKLIPPLMSMFEERMPKDPDSSKAAYAAALRAKVLDCLRGLLPAGTLTNMGVYGNGRFYESLIHKLHCHPLVELQDIGKRMHEEISKVLPSFIRRSEINHHTHRQFASYYEAMQSEIKAVTEQNSHFADKPSESGVTLLDCTEDAPSKVAGAILFTNSNHSLKDLVQLCRRLPEEEIARILDAGCNARESRRHRSPRALEHANFTFEIIADFGVYRDLHRHRMLTQERQLLNCNYGFYIPSEIEGTGLESTYTAALQQAKDAFDRMSAELPEEAQYVVPMAYNVKWYFHINLRALQWLCELRSQPAGHPGYRQIAQEMAKLV